MTRPVMTAPDHIQELTRGFTTAELVHQPVRGDDGRWRTTQRIHHVTNQPLLDQLDSTVTGTLMTSDGNFAAAYGSKPAGRIDVLALLHRIEQQSHDLAIEYGFETPDRITTKGRLIRGTRLPVRERLTRLAGLIGDKPHPVVKSWWATARILTQHDGPPYSPRVPCPVESCERTGSLRVRLSERLAFCVECHTVWADDNPDPSRSFGRLAIWSTWATEHLEGRTHLLDDDGPGGYDDLGYGWQLGYDLPLGYRVVCPECEVERWAMAERSAARFEAARAAKRAAA